MSIENKSGEVVKKRPGRPRKTPIKKPNPRNGISDVAKNPDNFIEFIYDNPLIFKKMWQYMKLMAVDKLQIIFRKNEVIIWCEDHHKKSKLRIRISANDINHYYCSETLDIGLLCKNTEIIMNTIDKSYSNIILKSKKKYTQKDIRILLNNEIEIEENHKIELIGDYDKIIDENKFLDEDYAIKFELPGRYFKKMVSDIKSFSDKITIRQDGPDEPLVFEYMKKDKKIKSYHEVKNNKIIKFKSNLQEDETFRVSFVIDYIKPISSALLSENIVIYAHESKPLMFSIIMDNETVELKILTEIIDGRNYN